MFVRYVYIFSYQILLKIRFKVYYKLHVIIHEEDIQYFLRTLPETLLVIE